MIVVFRIDGRRHRNRYNESQVPAFYLRVADICWVNPSCMVKLVLKTDRQSIVLRKFIRKTAVFIKAKLTCSIPLAGFAEHLIMLDK